VTNIGNVCGRKNFSVAFIQLQKVFDKDFRAKERRERLEKLKSRTPNIIGLIEELKSEAAPLYTAIRHLSGDSGSLPRVIVEAVRNMRRAGDGAVIVSRKATQAERERAIATGNARQGAPYYVSETIGRLGNIGAVSGASALRSALSEIEPAIRRLDAADIDSISDKDARKIDRVTTGLDSQLDRLRQLVDSAKAFVTRSNLSQLEAILQSQTDKKLFAVFLSSLPNS
jgi:hypothetical protein